MINLIRKVLKKNNQIYFVCADLYHYCKNLWFHFISYFSDYAYFKPISPSGKHKSQFGQCRALEKLNLLVTKGVFVEVGSNHPVLNSNSYYLESVWKYSGISIDPINYSKIFRDLRPRTKFINVAVDPLKKFVVMNYVKNISGWENQVSSIYNNILKHGRGFVSKKKKVKALPLSKICKNLNVIDLLLLDCEGHELQVLQSFNWREGKGGGHWPKVILTENAGIFYPRKNLKNYLIKKNYSLIARIGASDEIYVNMNQNVAK
jgi:hypothetical protein